MTRLVEGDLFNIIVDCRQGKFGTSSVRGHMLADFLYLKDMVNVL